MTDLIVDGNSLFARCWFAVKGEIPVALRLCVSSVLQLLDQKNDGRLRVPINRTLFGWDGRSKTDKHRQPKSAEYLKTRYRFQELLLELFNTVHGFHPDYEADDVVATAVFASKARQIFVVSGDKDLMQLQGGNVSYYDLNSKRIMSPRAICQKFFVKRPVQVPLAQAIMGDSGDGIVGVPNWGPKKVQKVFEWVTDQMNFSEALHVLKREIPEALFPFFMESLDKTLLHTEVEGIPEPSPLVFCDPDNVYDLGIEGIYQSYHEVARQYSGGKSRVEQIIRDSARAQHHLTPGQSSA